MQTRFNQAQLRDPATARSEGAIRACVHCGFCTATCPSYVVLGDELDSPRGRIYLIRDMLENARVPTVQTVRHIDRCLSCLACTTTCPSGVNYRHLIDHARAYIEATYRRPLADRALRALLATVLPRPVLFRAALLAARPAKPFARLLPARLRPLLAMAPARIPAPEDTGRPATHPAIGRRRHRVALLAGCAQSVLAPEINAAAIRVLTRAGVEVVVAAKAGCCGALTGHIGKDGRKFAATNIRAWRALEASGTLDAILVTTSGCGSFMKEYGQLCATDARLAGDAARVAALSRDITEFLAEITLPEVSRDFPGRGVRVAYHAACSLTHGQHITTQPKALLAQAGFVVLEPNDAHLCCGSAGTYNLLQPEIAGELRARKLASLTPLAPEVIASGNIGCLTQLAGGTSVPTRHTVQLLDWATGGPSPLGPR